MQKTVLIHQYASTPETGFGGRYYYLARELVKLGEKVTLIVSANHHLLREKPKFSGFLNREMHSGIEIVWVKTLPYKQAHSGIRVLNWFVFAVAIMFLAFSATNVKAVHYSSPSPAGFLGAWFFAKLRRAKLVFDVRDVWPESLVEVGNLSSQHVLIRLLSVLEKFAYRHADIITSNLYNFNLRLQDCGVDEEKFRWLPNGVCVDEIESSLEESIIDLPIELKGKIVVSYTGTLGAANALYSILKAAKLLQSDSRFAFLIVGSGKEKSDLVNYCIDNEIDNVTFMASVAKRDVYTIQAKSNILCVGAKSSPLYRYGVAANKLYEYIFSGVPVVYYISTPGYNPVSDAMCGVQIEPNDTDQFVNAILTLGLKSTAERALIAESAKKYIIDNHTYETLAHVMRGLSN